MTTHGDISKAIESLFPLYLQEDYDNSGYNILAGAQNECKGVLIGFDCTEQLVKEAIAKNCDLIITHHPLIFKELKKIREKGSPDAAIRLLIRHGMSHYCAHTNLDNSIYGVNGSFINYFSLENYRTLTSKKNMLKKILFYAPPEHAERISAALFSVGAGRIGKYSHCSFSAEGEGSFKAEAGSDPFVGKIGEKHTEKEKRIEIIFPRFIENDLIDALRKTHPYEEPAYDIYTTDNIAAMWGSGLIGHLPQPMSETDFLERLSRAYKTPFVRHSAMRNKQISKVAFCGGSGAEFIHAALDQKADAYVTGDLKYHSFLDYKDSLLLIDIGHWESEQYAVEILYETIRSAFARLPMYKTDASFSPVHYFKG